jgi:soluble lytic murein transglycosylase-like protein
MGENMSNLAVMFTLLSAQFNLPTGMLSAVCYVESHHNAKALHIDDGGSNSVGLCQLHSSTARMLGFKGDEQLLFNPKINAYWAAAYLRHQLDRYDNDAMMAISAYNAGSYRPTKNLDYVRKVLNAWKERL